jgi:4-hydroxy-3-methylbut-2-enyl diphosphate reductase
MAPTAREDPARENTPRLTILTPMRIERAALARALPDATLLSTGMGAQRSKTFAWPIGPNPATPVIVAGVAGGLSPGVRAGDLVVADELRFAGAEAGLAPIPVPSAHLLAGALRRLGLRVHVGPIVSSETIVHGGRRGELADTGALAVDMESAWLAERVRDDVDRPGTPFAVVRAIVDTTEKPLLRPGTALRSLVALQALRRAAPALQQWAAATDPAREVVLAAPRSFCAGVERAIEIVAKSLERYGAPVYVRRQIVHNTQVVLDLERQGAVFVQEADEVPRGSVLVLAAHGVSPAVRRQAAARGLTVIDGTCPLVSKVHAEVRRFVQRGETVFLVGHGDHEEVEGTLGEAPQNVVVVENIEQARMVKPRDPERVAYVTQTTLSRQDAESVIGELGTRFPKLAAPSSEDICFATTNRQQAVQAIADQVDLMLVVGSANSSNSRRLVEVAQQAGTPALLIDAAAELDLTELKGTRRVGITAGASAPPQLVTQLINNLAGLGPLAIREHRVTDETVTFSLPPGVS